MALREEWQKEEAEAKRRKGAQDAEKAEDESKTPILDSNDVGSCKEAPIDIYASTSSISFSCVCVCGGGIL